MKITISGKHLEIGESLKTHIDDGIKGVVTRHLGDVLEAKVVLHKDTVYQFMTDISIHVSRNFVVRARAEDPDPYRSVSLALEKMESRIHHYKTRLRHQKRAAHEDVLTAQQYVINPQETDEGEDNPIIIAEMSHEIPTLTVGEAVMRMDLGEAPLMMFKNSKNGNFNVIYRRNDGHIGWIDPAEASV